MKVQQLLQVSDGILRQLDEAEDRAWREALNLAIRTGSEGITRTLLRYVKFDFRQVHEALLVAVDTNQPHVVKLLLDRLDQEKSLKMDIKSFSLAFFDNSIDNSRFAPGVTPLTLACEKDLYEIVDMLMKKGHAIPRPHKVSCACMECSNGRKFDLLKFSLSRINTYKGIASRAHLAIASDDAMLTAFKLSRELKRLSKKEPEFKVGHLPKFSLSKFRHFGFFFGLPPLEVSIGPCCAMSPTTSTHPPTGHAANAMAGTCLFTGARRTGQSRVGSHQFAHHRSHGHLLTLLHRPCLTPFASAR